MSCKTAAEVQNEGLNVCYRTAKYQAWVDTINQTEKGFDTFSRGYESYGFVGLKNGDISYREWAPNAQTAVLIGDFSKSSDQPESLWWGGADDGFFFTRQLGQVGSPYEEE